MKFIAAGLFLSVLFTACNDSATQENGAPDSLTGEKAGLSTHTITLPEDSSKTGDDTSENWLLVPGVSAGQTKIDENANDVYQRLGQPDGGDAAMQKAVAIWWANHDTTDYSTAIFTERNPDSPAHAHVLEIRVTSPVFQTKEGIHTTSSLTEIKKIFTVKQTENYTDAGTKYTVFDSEKGIAFEMAPDNTCVAVIIHKPGITGQTTYLKFRTTNKFIK